jgi:hypothetical protein
VVKKAYEDKKTSALAKPVAVATPANPAAAAKPRNPYVLVLIDGNDYIVSVVYPY